MRLPGIAPEAVGDWLVEHVPELRPPLEFGLITGGRSNLTYQGVDADGRMLVLRRPPVGGVLSTAHDMHREWRFLTALRGTEVPVPEPVAYCADSAVSGAEFYVMEHVTGTVLADAAAAEEMSPQQRYRAGMATAECLAALHSIDPDEVGVATAGRRGGYLQRQLARWQRQVHQSGAANLDLLDRVHDALLTRVPQQERTIVHGDFRPGNISYAPDGNVRAVFDWELATCGDPLADLGWLVASWQQPGDGSPPVTATPSALTGFPSREELIARYTELSGRDVSELPYYVAFQRWRAACISAGVRARYEAGVMGDDGFSAQLREQHEVELAEAAWREVRALHLTG